MLTWGNPFILEMFFLDSYIHETAEWKNMRQTLDTDSLLTVRAIMQVMSTVQAQMKELINAAKPFTEKDVSLANLLHSVREAVVAKVGPSVPDESFNDFRFWKEPLDEALLDDLDLDAELDKALEKKKLSEQSKQVSEARVDPDAPAVMPKQKVEVSLSNIDQTSLREVLIELDELRPKWTAPNVFPTPQTLQEKLDKILIPVRRSFLNSK